MNKILISLTNSFLFLIIFSFFSYNSYGEEETTITEQIFSLQKDIKTLEKAVYSQSSERNNLKNIYPNYLYQSKKKFIYYVSVLFGENMSP